MHQIGFVQLHKTVLVYEVTFLERHALNALEHSLSLFCTSL